MYHCNVQISYIGAEGAVWDRIRTIKPLGGFSCEFSRCANPKELQKFDVIFANLTEFAENDVLDALLTAVHGANENAELIILAESRHTALCEEFFGRITDIWTMPMNDSELAFRLAKWQRQYKLRWDKWLAENLLESAINGTPDLVWFKALDGKHIKVNHSFCETVHKTREQVEGQKHAYIWDVPFEDPACIKSDSEVIEKRKTFVSDEHISTGDGERLLTTYKSPLYDIDGSVMGTVGIGIDVTRERAYEEEIIKKNRTLEKIFTSIDCGVISHSLDGKKIISINKAALEILGYSSADEMISGGFDLIAGSVYDEDKPKLREAIRSLKEVGDTVSVDYRVQHNNGKILHVTGNVKLLCENGEMFYQRFLLDCTAQKITEQENERRQMALIHALCIDYSLVCSFDLDTGVGGSLRSLDCDKHILRDAFSGSFMLEESLAPYISECVYEEDRELFREKCSQKGLMAELSKKDIFYLNYRALCCGQIKYFQMKAVRAADWDKTHLAVLGFVSIDDEFRKNLEQKRILEDALAQANHANKAKSEFLSNMSHDIRTPMNAIVGFTMLAMTHINNKEKVEEYLKKIMSSGNHLLSLINDVLDMSRIESGKMHIDEKPCSLPEILRELRNIIIADVNSKQLELNIDTVDVYDEDIICDKLRLNQVLLNLLNNAVKYTNQGGKITFRIIERRNPEPGTASYEFIVKDTGIGMDKEFLKHIFEPFERERNTTLSGIQGTGLGMSITKNIVDMMHGSITVESEQGIGTQCIVTFTFKLSETHVRPRVMPELKGFRALVVDDDFNTCDSVSYMLSQLGMRAEWTLSGREAVLRAKQATERNDEFKVYIVDCFLPDLNGLEVIRRIRRRESETVPIILLTSYDWTEFEDEARAAGVTAFCNKPLFMSDLKNTLSAVVNNESVNKGNDIVPEGKHSGRILLVEDNDLNQEIARELLTEVGFKIEIANNGQEAVETVKSSEPGYYQVVLMDVQMPVMNGYEATKAIRALDDERLANVPILAMTANAFDEDKQEALKCGMNGHLSKPIDVKMLLKTLDEIIK